MLRPATEAVLQTAPPRGAQCARRRMGAAERPDQVGVEDRRPELLGELVHVARRDWLLGVRRAGVVGEIVEPAELLDGVTDHALGRAGLGYVARRSDHIEALGAQLRCGVGATLVVGQMVERDLGAAAREQLDRRKPDARRAACHQRSLALEIAHVPPSQDGCPADGIDWRKSGPHRRPLLVVPAKCDVGYWYKADISKQRSDVSFRGLKWTSPRLPLMTQTREIPVLWVASPGEPGPCAGHQDVCYWPR